MGAQFGSGIVTNAGLGGFRRCAASTSGESFFACAAWGCWNGESLSAAPAPAAAAGPIQRLAPGPADGDGVTDGAAVEGAGVPVVAADEGAGVAVVVEAEGAGVAVVVEAWGAAVDVVVPDRVESPGGWPQASRASYG